MYECKNLALDVALGKNSSWHHGKYKFTLKKILLAKNTFVVVYINVYSYSSFDTSILNGFLNFFLYYAKQKKQ